MPLKLRYLKSWALSELYKVASSSPNEYKAKSTWLEKRFEDRDYLAESKISVELLPTLILPTSKSDLFEAENAIALHSALRVLNRSQASDDRLWTWLAHGPYWDYMRVRWPVDQEANKPAYVKEHYFLGQSRNLVRHGLARLWWFGQATYIEGAEEPYRLTRALLTTTDARQSVMERQFWRNQTILHPLLQRVLHWQAEGVDLFTPRERFRGLCKTINLAGGAWILDAIGAGGVSLLVDRYVEEIASQSG